MLQFIKKLSKISAVSLKLPAVCFFFVLENTVQHDEIILSKQLSNLPLTCFIILLPITTLSSFSDSNLYKSLTLSFAYSHSLVFSHTHWHTFSIAFSQNYPSLYLRRISHGTTKREKCRHPMRTLTWWLFERLRNEILKTEDLDEDWSWSLEILGNLTWFCSFFFKNYY